MKESNSTSPFAALTSQEQKEKWICWQCQHATEYIPAAEQTRDDERSGSLPELKLPQVKEEKQTETQQKPTIRHGQYDAVIRRMKHAQRQATAYTAWSEQS